MKSNILLSVVIVLSLVVLDGCVTPKDFTMTLEATREGLAFQYDGKLLADIVYLAPNELSEAEKKELMEALHQDLYKLAKRVGGTYEGRYDTDGTMNIKLSGVLPYNNRGESLFGGFVDVSHWKDGIMKVQSREFDSEPLLAYHRAGIDLDDLSGKVCFRTGEGITVVSHNAETEPNLISNCYQWNLNIAKGDILKIAFEVDCIKAEVQRQKELEQKRQEEAAERKKQQRIEELDAFVQELVQYRKTALEARATAETAWNNLVIESNAISIVAEIPHKNSANPKEKLSLHLDISVTNKNPFPVSIPLKEYIWEIKEGSGEIIAKSNVYLKSGGGEFKAGENKRITKSIKLYGIEDDPALKTKLLSGGCLVTIYPKTIRSEADGARGKIEPDGDPFLDADEPRKPHWVGKDLFGGGDNVDEERFDKLVAAQIQAAGGPGPLESTKDKTFSGPTEWYELKVVR